MFCFCCVLSAMCLALSFVSVVFCALCFFGICGSRSISEIRKQIASGAESSESQNTKSGCQPGTNENRQVQQSSSSACLKEPVPPFLCGNCRETVGTTGGFADDLVQDQTADLNVGCKYPMCNEKFTNMEYQRHLDTCEYRPIVCCNLAEQECDKIMVNSVNFVQHTIARHCERQSSEVLEQGWSSPQKCNYSQDDLEKDEDDKSGSTAIYETEGIKFLLHTRNEQAREYIWITAMSNEAEAAKFRAKVYVLDEDIGVNIGGAYCAKWNLNISTVRKTFEDLKYTKYCAIIPIKTLMAYSNKDDDDEGDKVWFQVKIYRV